MPTASNSVGNDAIWQILEVPRYKYLGFVQISPLTSRRGAASIPPLPRLPPTPRSWSGVRVLALTLIITPVRIRRPSAAVTSVTH